VQIFGLHVSEGDVPLQEDEIRAAVLRTLRLVDDLELRDGLEERFECGTVAVFLGMACRKLSRETMKVLRYGSLFFH
jgi:hypothetical protein